MADLIEKFFLSELTEDEDRELASQLEVSEEAAGRFAETAENLYLSFGLPNPLPPGNSMGSWHSLWGKGLMVLLVLGGLTAWFWPAGPKRVPAEEKPPVAGTVPLEKKAPVKMKVPVPVLKKEQKPVQASESDLVAAPPDPDFNTDYRNLKVVVDQENAGPVTVRILDANGIEVRRLYNGPLQAGKWAFQWDGILGTGRAASPGSYRIEVQGGSTLKQREITIK